MKKLKRVYPFLLDMIFPPVCLACRHILDNTQKNKHICLSCLQNIPINSIFFRTDQNFILAAATTYDNETIKKLIHTLKYDRIKTAQYPLGDILISYLETISLMPTSAIIIPIPLHPTKAKKRGFNQAELLAQQIGIHFHLPIYTNILKRNKNTSAQAKRTIQSRSVNVANCFSITPHIPFPKTQHIIIVDDVYTSGATLREAVKTFRKKKYQNIIGIVVAKT
ncbi:MAG: phosphoribosyltransferase family protein [bacterium]